MLTSIHGYPRMGAARELKFATESFFSGQSDEASLLATARTLRETHWREVAESNIDLIPSNDFSHYDAMLDTAILLGAVPRRYRDLGLSALGTLFAMARGYQGPHGDVKALPLRKWFSTNYHYLVPELEEGVPLSLSGEKPFDEFLEARALGIETRPTLIGPFTFLALAHGPDGTASHTKGDASKREEELARVYGDILSRFAALGAKWVAFDESALALDLSASDLTRFEALYRKILERKGAVRVLLQTSFGDIRDAYKSACDLPFDGIALDFIEGTQNLDSIRAHGFPKDKLLVAGLVNGKNIWKNDYAKSLAVIREIAHICGKGTCPAIAIGTSCSLLHVPHTVSREDSLDIGLRSHLAFAREKLAEIKELAEICEISAIAETAAISDIERHPAYARNRAVTREPIVKRNDETQRLVASLGERDWTRTPSVAERAEIQATSVPLPGLPATTIGSFPQTSEIKSLRAHRRKGDIGEAEYRDAIKGHIQDCIRLQERLGLDVLVHGEFERNDMVEYFGENLTGFTFTAHGWVQSYGTRCVKPPIVSGDVARNGPITVEWSRFAQSLTEKPVKGMLTGPVTILNWSFPREDIPLAQCAFQIALAIRDEALDLERAGIRVIQIDEAALKERLPLRKEDWKRSYLDWAIPAFRLTHSRLKAETQVHTHMCYSEFEEIAGDIDAMDADVISFEAARSAQAILTSIAESGLRARVGPGVYDIHSPRIPTVCEIGDAITRALSSVPAAQLWVNPDCGLKTREDAETEASLANMMEAVFLARAKITKESAS